MLETSSLTLWLKVSNDDLELPLAVADTAEELGRILGVPANCISSAISHARSRGHRSQYVKVIIDDREGTETDDRHNTKT